MKGVSEHTSRVFNSIREFELLSSYTLIGGTALSIQIKHRISEDLDFCKWQDALLKNEREIEWPAIEKLLKQIDHTSTEITDLFQVDFIVGGVKLSFYSNAIADSRAIKSQHLVGNIHIANVSSIGAMKLEVMSRRNVFRDYYDIYAILKEGYSLKEIVTLCGKYSRHRLSHKAILAILSDGSRFKYEEDFNLLKPKYLVDSKQIEVFIREKISEEYGRNQA